VTIVWRASTLLSLGRAAQQRVVLALRIQALLLEARKTQAVSATKVTVGLMLARVIFVLQVFTKIQLALQIAHNAPQIPFQTLQVLL